MKANKKIKSGVFADLFCDDEKDGKKNFLSLYNAIHGTNLTLENTKLERKEELEPERERTMLLSDAFIEPQEEPACEVKVKFANISGETGKNLPVVQNCATMKEYCEFMEIVARRHAELGTFPPDEDLIACYDQAISEAISKGVLVDYLSRKATEVRNMFFGEYDYDTDLQVAREEAAEQKAVEDAQNMLKKNYPTSDIAEITGLSLEQALELQKEPAPAPAN